MSNESDVARLLQQIDIEYSSAQQGLHGLAQSARHDFINARYGRIGELQEQLDDLVGHDQAMALTIAQLSKSGETR